MRWLVFFIKFVFLAAFFIISNGNLHLSAHDERQQFFDEYAGWAFGLVNSVGDLTGYVVEVEWLPDSDKEPEISEEKKTSKTFGDWR